MEELLNEIVTQTDLKVSFFFVFSIKIMTN